MKRVNMFSALWNRKDEMKVCVLISTYNGERFLEEQIASIIAQKGVEVDILVRDDGSSDMTCSLLERWQKEGKLKWYKGENLGFARSFMNLLKTASGYDYYAFCDQDDIWLEDKLQRAVTALEKIEDKVKLYCSNVYYYKDGQTYGGIHRNAQVFDKYTCMMRNISPGCTMVMSSELRNLLVSALPERLIAHDFWVFQVATLLGTVHYDFQPSMLYRQHENNQIGQKVSRKDIWKRRWKNITSAKKVHEREYQAQELLRCFSPHFRPEEKAIVRQVADYRHSFRKKMRLIKDKRYTMGSRKADFYVRMRLLVSKF